VPKDIVQDWITFLRNEYPTIAFKSNTQHQRTHLGQSKISTALATDELLSSSECIGAQDVMALLKNYCRNQNVKTSITVGVVGFPSIYY
jgi:nuclear GTP-binding protein